MASAKVEPIRPDAIGVAQGALIPDEVIQAVNELIAMEWGGKEAPVRLRDIEGRSKVYLRRNGKDETFDRTWFNLESLYELVGWSVEFDKPGYNEPGESVFIFRKKKDLPRTPDVQPRATDPWVCQTCGHDPRKKGK